MTTTSCSATLSPPFVCAALGSLVSEGLGSFHVAGSGGGTKAAGFPIHTTSGQGRITYSGCVRAAVEESVHGMGPPSRPATTKEITDMPDDITKRISRFIEPFRVSPGSRVKLAMVSTPPSRRASRRRRTSRAAQRRHLAPAIGAVCSRSSTSATRAEASRPHASGRCAPRSQPADSSTGSSTPTSTHSAAPTPSRSTSRSTPRRRIAAWSAQVKRRPGSLRSSHRPRTDRPRRSRSRRSRHRGRGRRSRGGS